MSGSLIVRHFRRSGSPDPEWLTSARRETIQQAVAAGADQVLLAAAAIGTSRGMRRIPGFDGWNRCGSVDIGMPDHGCTLSPRRPVLASAVVRAIERRTIRL